ncbi:MAG: hypothetical protein AAGI50_12780 [Pseudomonadota bacterium]
MMRLPLLAGLLLLVLAACGVAPPPPATETDISALAKNIAALDPRVDPVEAQRAAEITYATTAALTVSYGITDPPLIHNTKVNMGLRPRGLCWHWAEDLETRLKAEGFETLAIHRAIANADNPFRIDHSTAIIAARGTAWDDGVVIDPWRFGGRLYWGEVARDPDYVWHARAEVLARRAQRDAPG